MPEGREDPSGGPCYSRYARVREESIWRENVKKEGKGSEISPNFQLNLMRPTPATPKIRHSHNRIEIVTEKELKQSPQTRSQLTGFDEGSFEVKTIRLLARKSPNKFDLPATSQMEIGWLLTRPMKAETLRSWPDRGAVRWRQDTIPSLTQGKWFPEKDVQNVRPGTSSMPDIRQLNTKRWHRPRSKSDVSTYMENYIFYMGANPFGRVQKAEG